MNIFQHVQCCLNNFEIISKLFQRLNNFISVSEAVIREIKHWNNFKNYLKTFYFTCNHGYAVKVKVKVTAAKRNMRA